MSLTKEQIRKDFPLPAYNYKVDIDAVTIGFSEVTGLDLAFDTVTYMESHVASGIAGPNYMYMPGLEKAVNITLKKGFVKAKSIPVLYNWIKGIELNRIEKKDITVHLCDEKGESLVRWKVINAFPTKLSAPTFNASSSEVAIESMELMANTIEMNED